MAKLPATAAPDVRKVERLAACIARERSATIVRLERVLPCGDAEDAFQEACVRALSRLDRQRESKTLRPWFQAILRSVVAARLRRPPRNCALDEHDAPFTASSPEQRCGCGVDALRSVRASHRSALERVLIRGQDIADAALADCTTPGNLRVRLHRGKQELESAWLRCCGTCITEEMGADCRCHERRDAHKP
jgi:RNA polymerase sigma-70 factor (ECF subfamily)